VEKEDDVEPDCEKEDGGCPLPPLDIEEQMLLNVYRNKCAGLTLEAAFEVAEVPCDQYGVGVIAMIEKIYIDNMPEPKAPGAYGD